VRTCGAHAVIQAQPAMGVVDDDSSLPRYAAAGISRPPARPSASLSTYGVAMMVAVDAVPLMAALRA
jgi:hypothetical protein